MEISFARNILGPAVIRLSDDYTLKTVCKTKILGVQVQADLK